MIISGSKSVKRGQKNTEKAKTWNHTWFFQKIFALANLIYINSYNKRKKSVMSLYSFRTYFFTQCELQAPFSNLLTTAKGQLISKCPYEKSVWTKIATKIFPRFLFLKFTTSRLLQNRVYLLANRT